MMQRFGGEGRRFPQPCSFGKSGSPEASGDGGGRLGRHQEKEKKLFFLLFYRF